MQKGGISLQLFSKYLIRFSDFEWLSEILQYSYPYLIIPINPEKNIWANWALQSKESEDSRKRSLNSFLQKLLRNEILRESSEVISFLSDSETVSIFITFLTNCLYKIYKNKV